MNIAERPEYEPIPDWGKLPDDIEFYGEATSVAVGLDGAVYVFNRGTDPMVVLDACGQFVAAWGKGQFDHPHGISIGPSGRLFLADDGGHFVERRSRDGECELTIGVRGKPTPNQSGRPFNRPTSIVEHPITGDLYVTDGYGNSRVHRFSADGTLLMSWGRPGSARGEFSVPHGICVLDNGNLAVCDRENFRVQVFEPDGTFVSSWHFHRPAAITRGLQGDPYIYIAELGGHREQRGVQNLGHKVHVIDQEGRIMATLGDAELGSAPSQFIAPHGISVDVHGNIYVAEVSRTYLISSEGIEVGRNVVSLRKWRRLA